MDFVMHNGATIAGEGFSTIRTLNRVTLQYEFSYIHRWNLKNDTNELIYETETDSDTENRLGGTKEERG